MIRKLASCTGLLLAGLVGHRCGAQTNGPPLADDFKIPFWYKNFNVHGGFGYKDNVLLSSSQPRGSAFWSGGAEVLFYRLPTHGWQFNAFASVENVGYLDRSTGVSDEQIGIATAQLTKDLGRGWKSGLGANYTFSHQVLDVSAQETNRFTTGEVLGHNATARWFVRKDFQANWAEAELDVTRQLLKAPLDNYWQTGPRLTLGHSYGRGSDVSVSYQWFYVAFDKREQVDTDGISLAGTSLRFQPQVGEAIWHHVWDGPRHWHTTTKLGLEILEDNGSGFFDYRQYRIAQEIKYSARTWLISGQFRIGHYDYSLQTVSDTDRRLRRKTALAASVRAEKNLGKSWKLYASYLYDRSFSNLDFDRYVAGTSSAGVEWHF